MDAYAFEQALRLREEISRSPGAQAYGEVRSIRRTHRLFDANASELRAFLAQYSDPVAMLHLWDLNHPKRLAAFFDDFDRLLHNYLASAMTLRDHARILCKRYRDEHRNFGDEYDTQIAANFGEPRLRFIQDLRNYMLHYRLPVT